MSAEQRVRSYQVKLILKNSKPPVWKRCMIPAGITFSQLALLLEEILETDMSADYEYEFYQAGLHVREWREGERQVTAYNYDYLCSSDTYIDNLANEENWFTFRPGDGSQFRAEIEKRLPNILPWPSVIKQKGGAQTRKWTEPDAMNLHLKRQYPVSYGEPDYREFKELKKCRKSGETGITAAENPVDKTERQEKSAESMLRALAEKMAKAFSGEIAGKIEEELENCGGRGVLAADRLQNLLEESEWNMKRELREKLFGNLTEFQEPRRPDIKGFLVDETKEELLEMAEDLGLSHFKSLNKNRLAEKIRDEILKPDVMAQRMLLLSDAEMEAFERAAAKGKGFYPTREEMNNLEKLYDLAYVMIYNDDYVEVPQEVLEVYKKFNTPEYQEKRRGTFWMYHCLMFVEMLYATAPVRIVRQMLGNCLERKVKRKEFEELFANVPEELNPCALKENRVIYKEILRDRLYLQIEKTQEGKEFYIPDPNEILDYTENGYPTSDPSYRSLKTFLIAKMDLGISYVEALMPAIWNRICMGDQLSDIMEIFEEEGIVFQTEELVREFVSIIMEVNNNTRMLIHRGHTPNEIVAKAPPLPRGKFPTIVPMSSTAAELLGGAADEIRGMGFDLDLDANADEITTMAMPDGLEGKTVTTKKKIYPNDPCPCGSGKKYKKCCGKKK